MPVAFLVTGVLRSFAKHLLPFIEQLPEDFHIFLSIAPSDCGTDKFLNTPTSLDALVQHPRIRAVLVDKSSDAVLLPAHLTQREKNSLLQWYRLEKLIHTLPTEYTTVVRCRPDIRFNCDPETFLAYMQPLDDHVLRIPTGFDVFDTKCVDPHILDTCINDQFAIGSRKAMEIYCRHYTACKTMRSESNPGGTFVSEHSLYRYLTEQGLQIQRIDLPYNLVLSECFTFSICGDSASGKSSLSRLLQEVLPFDLTLLFETDRYHKWERGAAEYKQFTHLHPEANHLEKLSTDAYKLRLGKDVYIVDYDHETGHFTEPQCVKANNYIIFCGLHTLYAESLRDIMDLRIYMDTDPHLKEVWKIARDTRERGASVSTVLKTIQDRHADFQQFISPQIRNANIVVRYRLEPDARICLTVLVREDLCSFDFLTDHILPFSSSVSIVKESDADFWAIACTPSVQGLALTAHARTHFGYRLKDLRDGYEGMIQYIILSLTWRQH